MHPIKAKALIPEVASDLNLPEDLVKEVTSYYWEEVRKSLSTLTHQRVHLTNLGDFVIKHWKLEEKIDSLEKWEESNRLKGMQEITARFKTAENLFNLKNIKTLMEQEAQRSTFIKLHKKTTHNEPKRKHNKDLES